MDSMISSANLNGPVALVDSALSLFVAIIDVRSRESPNLINTTAERILQWLFDKWSPANFSDRALLSQFAIHVQPSLVLELLSSCTNRQWCHFKSASVHVSGPIARAWLLCSHSQNLTDYLLLADRQDAIAQSQTSQRDSVLSERHLSRSRYHIADALLLDFCQSELEKSRQQWKELTSDGTKLINADMMRVATSLCIITSAISLWPDFRDANKAIAIKESSEQFGRAVSDSASNQDCEQGVVDGMLYALNQFFPKLASTISMGKEDTSPKFARNLGLCFLKALQSRRYHAEDVASNENGLIDIDDGFDSEVSLTSSERQTLDFARENVAAQTDAECFRYSTVLRLSFITSETTTTDTAGGQTYLSTSLIDSLISLRPHELIACRPLLKDLATNEICMDKSDAVRLFDYLGQEILQSYEHERCEVSLGVCLDFMAGLAEMWTEPSTDDLWDSCSDIYHWFIEIALGKGIASASVYIDVASLLQKILKVRPEYTRSLNLPSARTSLLYVLQEGDISVKFHVAERISEIFGLFVLKSHEAIFEDVLESLPRDIDWLEGIALRLLVLARLASSWFTLLRRCVYHIFETPGLVPEATVYATWCMTQVSNALMLESPQKLFVLFVPQILYTWLETQTLQSIPYKIFGYHDLLELLNDIQDEAVGQLLMRGKDEEVGKLAGDLGVSPDLLIENAFHKAIAYTLGRDISVPPPENGSVPGGEVRIRKRLGNDKFMVLLHSNFAKIIALLFRTIEQEDHIERAFTKHTGLEYSAKALRTIKNISSSDSGLPANQQPSFKAKYLIDEINHLCRRTSHDIFLLWTPALFVFVVRELLNATHPALGSLHACSVIRRIRILVSLAGQTALQDYPLEMLLHALRPYLTDRQCADDAIGIVQFLLQNSKSYLYQVPHFVAGLSLAVFTSSRAFFLAPHESTTQESEHRATISKSQAFHSWLGSYLDEYDSPNFTEASRTIFQKLLSSARNIRNEGNPTKGTHESDLLKSLLEDGRRDQPLLKGPSRNLALRFLCADFRMSTSFRDDFLGSDTDAATDAVAVWRSCKHAVSGKPYLSWAARVLGRAFASSGRIYGDLIRESDPDIVKRVANSPTHTSSSEASILLLLCDLLSSDERSEVNVAEMTLQLIASRLIEREEVTQFQQAIPRPLTSSLDWDPYQAPAFDVHQPPILDIKKCAYLPKSSKSSWIRQLAVSVAHTASEGAIVGSIPPILTTVDGVAEKLFPYVLHLALFHESDRHQAVRQSISDAFNEWFRGCDCSTTGHVRLLINTIIYLRTQPIPRESSKADREHWLDLDYQQAANAAAKCQMFKTALLFLEIHSSKMSRGSRRSSVNKSSDITNLLLSIFKSIDDPDSFYGVEQQPTLASVMDRLEYERDGFKGLLFRGAHYDSQLRLLNDKTSNADSYGIARVLGALDMNGLAFTALSKEQGWNSSNDSRDQMLQAARKLEQWDVPVLRTTETESTAVFRAFQSLNSSADPVIMSRTVDDGLLAIMERLTTTNQTGSSLHSWLRSLAVLTEIDETITSQSMDQLKEVWSQMQSRSAWMLTGRFEDVSQIVSSRETLFSTLSRRYHLQKLVRVSPRDARHTEVEALLHSSKMSRSHGALQNSLVTASYLSEMIAPCQTLGINVSAAIHHEEASVLWDQGEMIASIRMLQAIEGSTDFAKQSIQIGKAELLSKLGHQIAEARLERPDEIIRHYLSPAIQELKGVSQGAEAGQVFHEFASFCDQQLQNQDNLEDFQRIQGLRQRKEAEVRDLEKMIKKSTSSSRDDLRRHRARAKQWFELDDREFQRIYNSRQSFLRQSLENYLLSLQACETFNNDVLRFCALWLENSNSTLANDAVSKYIGRVPSRRFAPLMNQLTSRLLDTSESFQSLLSALVLRVCVDHPYHGMYQIFAITRTKPGDDETAAARSTAASKIAERLKVHERAGRIWRNIHNTNLFFIKFAIDKLDSSIYKQGSKVALNHTSSGKSLVQSIETHKIPPPTMKIMVRPDCDYSDLPFIRKFHPEMTVLTGVSTPKKVTAFGSDGMSYKQIYKGSNDDLRQDCIMEQVFEQVSDLLQNHRSTRQRDLHIRTYKVVPLNSKAGIIEFVSDTIALHDYLMPAHQKHHPKDLKPSVCRKSIADVQSKSVDVRVKAYHLVTERFTPVMRYFFMELFNNPDDWFEKRLAYSRSTAAISMLGHVLGLGDRHGHNILLDEKTGEVVHIDLGVAFESGRVLPVPEVVPFRLTRDIVDGMGITKTEGVFRRCCEFTLDALRTESYSIMTILDVLRYDPLHNWTLSPLRIKKMQEAQSEAPEPEGAEAVSAGGNHNAAKDKENEQGEADRALTVVAKKLSKSLSVTATVNELIQQASDERNLAVLYCGWAAYA
ncbi:MAG: hypothetical protein M1819_000368 [Sarea resinae]|nr:MAG: hypothetical protein M1819_000368 [Sarea resinae]